MCCSLSSNATHVTELYTLSLHDALPISASSEAGICRANSSDLNTRATVTSAAFNQPRSRRMAATDVTVARVFRDRKSTRLNSSHRCISYAVFCLKKKKQKTTVTSCYRHQ